MIAVSGAVGGAVHQQLVEVGESFEGGASAMHEQLSLVGEALESSLPTSNEVLEKASGAVGKVGEAVHTVGVTVGGQIEAVEASLDEAVEEAVHTVNELVGSAADQLSNALPLLAEDVSAVAQSVRSTFAEPAQQQEEEKAQLTLDEEVERALEEDEVIVVEEKVKMDRREVGVFACNLMCLCVLVRAGEYYLTSECVSRRGCTNKIHTQVRTALKTKSAAN